MMFKKGFTLAEVLVTLGLLSVLGAILIPAVTSLAPDKNKVMFRKAYNTLSQAVSKMINDDLNYPDTQTASNGTYTFQRGFNYTTATSNGTTNKFCYFLAQNLNTVGTIDCPSVNESGISGSSFTTSDGMEWSVYPFQVSDKTNNDITDEADYFTTSAQFPINLPLYGSVVAVDLNGSSTGPNCTDDTVSIAAGSTSCSSGTTPDQFAFMVRYDGKITAGWGPGADTTAEDILTNPTENTSD